MPTGQIVTGFVTEFEDPHIWRRNRTKMVKIHADPRSGLPSQLFARVKPQIDQPGYAMAWGGEAEDSARAWGGPIANGCV